MGIKQIAGAVLGVTLSETAPEPDFSADVTPPTRSTSDRDPLTLPAFYRGVVFLTNLAAPMTVNAWRGNTLVDSPLIRQPDPWMTRRRFIARTVTSMILHGNAYWRILRTPQGVVTGLRVADRGRAYRGKGGAIRYQLVFDGQVVDLPAVDVEHLRFLEIPGALDGLGPVQACRATLEGIATVRAYADNWFDSEGADGVLTTDQRLQPGEAREHKREWYRRDPEFDRGGPSLRVLGAGLSYTPFFLNPKDAQWLDAQADGVLVVARLLGLPGDYLLAAVEGSSLTYSNLEMIDTSVVKRTVLPDYLTQIEEALSNVQPRGQDCRFDLADFLRPDAKTRADIDAIYIDKQVYDAQHVRDRDRITAPNPATDPEPTGAPE